jgi:hypothetical protein
MGAIKSSASSRNPSGNLAMVCSSMRVLLG